jgi:cytochrome b subunit of formate dehydrogenase
MTAVLESRPSEGGAMNTLWTIVTIAVVIAVVGVVVWAFLIAPLTVPRRAAKQ